MEYAVSLEGDAVGTGHWVIHTDAVGERVLLSNDDTKTLYWVAIKDCRFFGFELPGAPKPVILVQPESVPGELLLPTQLLNRQQRRHNGGI